MGFRRTVTWTQFGFAKKESPPRPLRRVGTRSSKEHLMEKCVSVSDFPEKVFFCLGRRFPKWRQSIRMLSNLPIPTFGQFFLRPHTSFEAPKGGCLEGKYPKISGTSRLVKYFDLARQPESLIILYGCKCQETWMVWVWEPPIFTCFWCFWHLAHRRRWQHHVALWELQRQIFWCVPTNGGPWKYESE